jgi:hypothetical protein
MMKKQAETEAVPKRALWRQFWNSLSFLFFMPRKVPAKSPDTQS